MIQIKNLKIKYRTALAPMASLTNVVLRKLFDEIGGVGFMVTEMISAEGIRRGNQRTLDMLGPHDFSTPQFVQLFGTEPVSFKEAIRYIQNETAFSGIDINMGCPVKKIIRRGAGAALLKNPLQASRILNEIRKITRLPLTVKIRLLESTQDIFKLLDMLQGEGVDAITVHFRLISDRYSERARWEYAPALKKKIRTVFIGNGDIKSVADAREKFTAVDAIMVGRGALFNPFIFTDLINENENGQIGLFDRTRAASVARRLLELIELYVKPELQLKQLKAYTRFVVTGLSDSKRLRKSVYETDDFKKARSLLSQFYGLKEKN